MPPMTPRSTGLSNTVGRSFSLVSLEVITRGLKSLRGDPVWYVGLYRYI